MLAKRIIPCLDVLNGRTVKGINFLDLKDAGDISGLASRYSEAGADELVFWISRQVVRSGKHSLSGSGVLLPPSISLLRWAEVLQQKKMSNFY